MVKTILHKKNVLKTQLLEKYVTLITDFFELLNQSDLKYEFVNLISVLYVGINTINRVFEYVIYKTKNMEKTVYYSQKAYVYYLEYMEQVLRSNLSQSLNTNDAIIFVYKKTIFDLHDGENNQSFNTMSNIMSLREEILDIDEKEWKPYILNMFKTANILFYWENSGINFNERYKLCQLFLSKLLLHCIYNDVAAAYLEIIQQHMHNIKNEKYVQLLVELIDHKCKKKQANLKQPELPNEVMHDCKTTTCMSSNDSCKNENILMTFFIDKNTLFTKFEDGDMKEFVRWINMERAT